MRATGKAGAGFPWLPFVVAMMLAGCHVPAVKSPVAPGVMMAVLTALEATRKLKYSGGKTFV